MDIKGISSKLKQLRVRLGLKQTDLANSLGVTPQAVSKWERGQNWPDLFLIGKIAALFDVSTDYLFGMHEESRDVFEATVFCSGLNRFAERGRKLSAKELALWTSAVLGHMTRIALQHGGVPVKYTGDGFLCFFSGQDHAGRAARTAADIDRIHGDKDTVIFLHTGQIYFGLAGHPDYASRDIYGDTVNQAFLMLDAFSKKVRRGVGMSGEVARRLRAEKAESKAGEGKTGWVLKKSSRLPVPRLGETADVYHMK